MLLIPLLQAYLLEPDLLNNFIIKVQVVLTVLKPKNIPAELCQTCPKQNQFCDNSQGVHAGEEAVQLSTQHFCLSADQIKCESACYHVHSHLLLCRNELCRLLPLDALSCVNRYMHAECYLLGILQEGLHNLAVLTLKSIGRFKLQVICQYTAYLLL